MSSNKPSGYDHWHHRSPEEVNKNRREHRRQWVRLGIEYGLCLCGCGERTIVSQETDRTRGWLKGEPRRFIRFHHLHSSPVEYLEEDRGFETPCWVWQRGRTSNGYALGGQGDGSRLAHRQNYEAKYGPVPEGMDLDHLCRVRHCVNPDHVEPTTRQVNAARGSRAKLSMEIARDLRRRWATWPGSKRSFAEVAGKELGVHAVTVEYILRGRTWKEPE